MSNSIPPHGLKHSRHPCPSPIPRTHSNSVHWVSDAVQPSHPLSSPSPPIFSLSQQQGLFKWVSSSHKVAKVLEFQLQHQSFQYIQDCFPLGWTGWISLESMVLSRVFSNTTVWVTDNYYWHCVTVFGLSLFSCTLVSLGFTWDGITEFLSTILIFSHWPSVLKVCGSLSSSVRGGEEALYHVVCRILVPQSGIEPMLPTVEVQSPSHQTAREVPLSRSKRLIKMRFSKIICMCML